MKYLNKSKDMRQMIIKWACMNQDIKDAKSFIQDEIQKKFPHDKNAIQVIITNIIHLNYCTKDEFWGDGS